MLTRATARVRNFVETKRLARFVIASGVAAATSAVVFPLMYLLGCSTTACSIGAFIAGSIPNWTINRHWTWKVEGDVAFGREVVAFAVVAAVTLVLLSLATGWTHDQVRTMHVAHLVRTVLVTGTYFAVLAVLYGVRFLIYEFWIFSGESRIREALSERRAALRSRRQVWTAARANRIP
jgi:putative flippase GtrA